MICVCCPECYTYVLAADSSSIMKTNYLPYLGCPVAHMGFEIRCNLSKRPGPQVTIHSIVPYIHEVSPFKFRFQVHIYAHFKNARERLPGCLSSPHCVCVPLHSTTRIAEPTFGKIKRRLQIFQKNSPEFEI